MTTTSLRSVDGSAPALGRKVDDARVALDVFDTPPGLTAATFETSELVCACPITGQPDLYGLTLDYGPDAVCLESKSLKLYLWGFQSAPRFAEQLAADIADDLWRALDPIWLEVELRQAIRGGLALTARSRKERA